MKAPFSFVSPLSSALLLALPSLILAAPAVEEPKSLLTAVNTASLNLTVGKAELIMGLLTTYANLSWEIGVHAEALTEYSYPSLSVYSSSFSPPPSSPIATPVLNIASSVVLTKTANTLPFTQDTSVADPASIGQAILLASYTIGANSSAYTTDAVDELYFLMNVAPRTTDGAISHLIAQTQLWSDSVYMVPPFMAYYGALTSNATLMIAGYTQIELYRNYLGLPNFTAGAGLWRHQALGTSPFDDDNGAWATGNGWAAAGIVRVLATFVNSPLASQLTSQSTDLASWANEILATAWPQVGTDHLFLNYFNGSIYSSAVFPDVASTALLTAATYRLATVALSSAGASLLPTNSPFTKANFNSSSSLINTVTKSRLAVYAGTSNSTGIVAPVVDPLSYKAQATGVSPEAEAFVLMMEAAYTDWLAAGGVNPNIPGYIASGPTGAAGRSVVSWLAMIGAFVVGFALL